jgi:hypothetical protein
MTGNAQVGTLPGVGIAGAEIPSAGEGEGLARYIGDRGGA